MGTVGTSVAVVVLLLAGLGSVGAFAAPRPGPSPLTSDATGTIVVAAVADYGYQPDLIQNVPVNANITVTFTDDDVLQHTFTISSREGFVIPAGDSDAQLTQFFVSYPAQFSATVNGSGEQSIKNFTSPATPGWYEFVCTISGHFQNGMYGFIAFGEDLPSNLTSPGRVGLGESLTLADDVGIGVVALAAVLGLALWWRRRSHPPSADEPSDRSRST